jgi:ribonuclease HI
MDVRASGAGPAGRKRARAEGSEPRDPAFLPTPGAWRALRKERNMGEKIDAFERFRSEMNEAILENGTRETKRFFNLDGAVYEDGALPAKTKELLGLVGSMVLRCNDCITYHVLQCRKHGVTGEELTEAFDVALIVGGSIVIPHLRHARAILNELEDQEG